ncbi:MAG: insulinase family protein, partial [Lachnospiraceae bacterium]|nr:insulinase family protein [Lachnospiraceae bacterium]
YRFVSEVHLRYIFENAAEAVDLMKQMMFHSKFEDKKRMLELIQQEKAQQLVRINNSGNAAASLRATSYFSEPAKITDDISGITYYYYLKEFEEHFDERIEAFIDNCRELQKKVFRQENMIVSTTGDNNALALAKLEIPGIINELSTADIPDTKLQVTCEKKNEGFKTAAMIQYVGRAGNFKNAGFEYSGAMKILRVILSYDYFWINIRVKGGAYGCSSNFARSGNLTFSSYRDPNLSATNDIFEGTDEYVKNFEVDERDMTKYIIGTISGMDTPLTPFQNGMRSFTAYMTGNNINLLQKEREEVIDATPEDIKALAAPIRAALNQGYICVVGNENTIEEEKELFEKTYQLV